MSETTPSKPVPSGGSSSPAKGTTLNPKAIAALVILVISVIFIFSNLEDQTVNWLFFEFKAPGWILYLLLFVSGAAIGFFLGRNRYKRQG